MAYIGNEPVIGQWRKLDDISGGFNGSETNFTTQVGGANVTAGSANQLLVSLGGVLQEPGTDYSVSSSTITFTTAPAASLSFFAVLAGDALSANTPSDGSVTTAKLGSNLTVDLDLGSAGTPSLTFDADSGLFSGGDNQVAVSTSGVERVEFGASEVVFNDGGANYDFRVEGDTDANLLFVDASTDRVGIGTNSPTELLHVAGNMKLEIAAANNATRSISARSDFGSGTFFDNASILLVQDNSGSSGGHIEFQTMPSGGSTLATAITIDDGQRVGIGTTTPDDVLDVRSGAAGFAQFVHASGQGGVRISGTGASSSANLVFSNDHTSGITDEFTIQMDGATDDLLFIAGGTGGTEACRITEEGRFLIGLNSNTNNFAVVGSQQQLSSSTGASSTRRVAFVTPTDTTSTATIDFGSGVSWMAALIKVAATVTDTDGTDGGCAVSYFGVRHVSSATSVNTGVTDVATSSNCVLSIAYGTGTATVTATAAANNLSIVWDVEVLNRRPGTTITISA